MAASSPAFDPAVLLYYAPELSAFSNIITVEQATSYHASNPVTYSNIVNYLPAEDAVNTVNTRLFLLQNVDRADVSGLNMVIRAALSNSGLLTPLDIDKRNVTFELFTQPLRLVASNTLEVLDSEYVIWNSNLQVGDVVRIARDQTSETLYTVTGVTPNGDFAPGARPRARFTVSNSFPALTSLQSSYMLTGVRLVDVDRIAAINYVRVRRSGYPPVSPFEFDSSFNYALYQLLYPETRVYGKEQCFLDYVGRNSRGEYRVGYGNDIMNVNAPTFPFPTESMYVRSNVYVGGFLSLGDGNVRCATDIVFTAGSFTLSNAADVARWRMAQTSNDGTTDAVRGDLSILIGTSNAFRFGASNAAAFMTLNMEGIDINGRFQAKTMDVVNFTVRGELLALSNIVFGSNTRVLSDLVTLCNITASGNITSQSVYTTSDTRLKSDIQRIASEDALDKLTRIGGYSFKKDGKECVGLLAQEVDQVLPQVVGSNENGLLSVAYGDITALLIEALHGIQARLERLENSV